MPNFIFDLNNNMEPIVPEGTNANIASVSEQTNVRHVSVPEVIEILSSDEENDVPIPQYFSRNNILDTCPDVFSFYGAIAATEEYTTR